MKTNRIQPRSHPAGRQASLPARIFAVALAVLATGPLAASNVFIRISDVPTGESTDTTFTGVDGWNELGSCNWEVTAASNWTSGGGAQVGKPNPGTFQISRHVDSASGPILKDITTGKAATKVEIAVRAPGAPTGTAAEQTYLRYEFSGVYFTSVGQSDTDGDRALETVKFVYKEITVGYKPTDPTTGALGPESAIKWNIPAGTVTGP